RPRRRAALSSRVTRSRARRASRPGARCCWLPAAVRRLARSRVVLPAPLRRATEPRRHGLGVPRLERALELAQRLFERAERGEQLVAVHEEDLGPERRLRSSEARGVACPWAERRTRRSGA